MKVGQVVAVKTWQNLNAGKGNIKSISPQGKSVTVTMDTGNDIRFFRDGKTDTYIQNPGAGQFGHMLNNRFTAV